MASTWTQQTSKTTVWLNLQELHGSSIDRWAPVMRQTSTGKASVKIPGKGSSSNGDKKQKSDSASRQQQVLPESHGHDAFTACPQVCV